MRTLEIQFSNKSYFSGGDSFISMDTREAELPTIGKYENNYYHIIPYRRSFDIGLFHEIVHWYHFLRDTERYFCECNNNNIKHINNYYVGKHYYSKPLKRLFGGDFVYSEFVWVDRDSSGNFFVPFEEIRTILGIPYFADNYLQGDDISENLYRMCVEKPLRFGYGLIGSYYEDSDVINEVMRTVCCGMTPYRFDSVGFQYSEHSLLKGLGGCRIRRGDIGL